MFDHIDLKNILILDIETVPQHATFDDLSDRWKELWALKIKYFIKDDITASDLYNRAGMYAEFGKIICISAGYFCIDDSQTTFRIKSFYGEDERLILSDFCKLLSENFNTETDSLCAHNGREFDFPYLSRRCLINGLYIPCLLNNSGKKPWEVQLLDTMDLWKFGDHKNFTSLKLLSAVFEIDSPKEDIDGSQVWSVYWIDKDIDRIKLYCQRDVLTVAQLLLRFKGMELLKQESVVYTN